MDPIVFYKALADETRLRSVMIISLKREMCVCDLMDVLQASQPKVSRHLADLRNAGILVDERRGKWVYYSINPKLPQWMKEVIQLTSKNSGNFLSDILLKTEFANPCQSKC